MCEPHAGRTNRDVFHERFRALTGVDLDEPETAGAVTRFYAEVFPTLQRTHGPRPGGSAAVGAAREAGLAVALATNPIFPRAAIDERMRWAGLRQEWFDLVTSYENMHACKPASDYFAQTAELLGVRPDECLMVGDDPNLDLAADRIGMSTYYVGDADRCHRDVARVAGRAGLPHRRTSSLTAPLWAAGARPTRHPSAGRT